MLIKDIEMLTIGELENITISVLESVTPPPLPITDVAGFGLHAFGSFGFAQWDQNPVGYEYPRIDSDPNLLIVYDEDTSPVAILEDAQGVFIEEELNGIENLELILPIDSPKWPEIKGERYVRFQGREFVISGIGDKNDETGQLLSNVQCVINAVHELNSALNRTLSLDNMTATGGLMTILEGTAWSVGAVDSTDLRSLGTERKTALSNLRDWTTQHTSYLTFDSLNRKVNMLKNPGKNNGVQILLGKNQLSVERYTDTSNIITRLWPYGKDNLGIETANGGISYKDNFAWYISQGHTLTEIQADIQAKGKASRFLKEGEFTNSNYTDAQSLMNDAQAYLASACMPKTSYAFKIMDLSSQPGYEHEIFSLGDTLTANDEKLGITTTQYVVRRKWYPWQPYLDECVLASTRGTTFDTASKTARTIEIIDQRIGSWNGSSDKVEANWQAWQRAHILNADNTIPIELLRGIWYAANSAIRAGKSESVTIDDAGLTIAEHTIVEDHSQTGAFGQFGFGTQAIGDNSTDVKIVWKTDRYQRSSGGATVFCAGEGLPIRTGITPDGILAPIIIITDEHKLVSGDGYTFIGTSGMQVVDDLGATRVFTGHYASDKWGLQILDGSFELKTAASGARLELDTLGLRGYNSTGQTVELKTDGTFALKTAGTGARIEHDNAGIRGYNAEGVTFNLDAATGKVTAGIFEGVSLTGTYVEAKDTMKVASNVWNNVGSEHGIQFGNTMSGYDAPATIKYTQGHTGDGLGDLDIYSPIQVSIHSSLWVQSGIYATLHGNADSSDYADSAGGLVGSGVIAIGSTNVSFNVSSGALNLGIGDGKYLRISSGGGFQYYDGSTMRNVAFA